MALVTCPHCKKTVDNTSNKCPNCNKTISYSAFDKNAPKYIKLQMLSNVVECDPYSLICDMPVTVTFEKLDDEFYLPKFKPLKVF